MDILLNPYRNGPGGMPALCDMPFPASDPTRALAMLTRCPAAARTPLQTSDALADRTGVARVSVKDERGRMGLGSFKALGAAYVIARDAEAGVAKGRTYICASAGNHGLSVAAGAAAFGAAAQIYLADTVPEAFAARLRALGAEVVRAGATYEDSMQAAQSAAHDRGLCLLSDSSWPGYVDPPHILMEGYLVLMHEATEQITAPPSHIFLQAGVGGLAAACAAHARQTWGNAPRIIIVEPQAAPALQASIQAGEPRITTGPVSSMGRLDCKEPSLIALKGLSRDADVFATLSEAEGKSGAEACADAMLESTPSGAAGLSALLASGPHRCDLGLDERSHVLAVLSETAG